jgi:hypothetical protein
MSLVYKQNLIFCGAVWCLLAHSGAVLSMAWALKTFIKVREIDLLTYQVERQ